MEKEKVLEIEIKKINNEYSAFYPIKMDIDKLTEISDGKSLGDGVYIPYIELRISCYCYEIYLTSDEVFPQVIKNNCIEELKQKIDEVNKEFEVSKKWRAEEGEIYYSIAGVDVIKIDSENLVELDNRRYDLGNYFKTEAEAQKVIDSKEWKDFWAKVRAGEIGND